MEVLLTIGGVIVALVAFFSGPLWDVVVGIVDDGGNRNDRGKLKRSSDKYVSR
jgi:hypothetical protein